MDQPAGRSVLAIRHVAFEDLGSFAPALQRAGFAVRYAEAGFDDLAAAGAEDCDLLVVLGGPIGANDAADFPVLADELRLIERRLRAGRPLLGICLGAQLIAKAMGARVGRAAAVEIGFAPVALSEAGRASCLAPLADVAVLHWHGDAFDLPAGARHLAATPACPNQAFAAGDDDRVLALQFHAEVTARGLERWLIGHAGELLAAGISVHDLRRDAARHGAALQGAAERLLGRWLAEIAARASAPMSRPMSQP